MRTDRIDGCFVYYLTHDIVYHYGSQKPFGYLGSPGTVWILWTTRYLLNTLDHWASFGYIFDTFDH